MRPVHEADCLSVLYKDGPCSCADSEDQMVEEFQVEKPYVRTPRVPVSDPNAPFQSLAMLIRSARTDGLLKPVQGYIDRAVKAGQP